MEQRSDRSMPRARPARVVLAACVLALVLGAAPAHAARNLITGFWDGGYTSTDDSVRQDAFDKTVSEGAGVARIDIRWAVVAHGEPTVATNPADPAYDFSAVDLAVRSAAEHGLDVMFTVYQAPA